MKIPELFPTVRRAIEARKNHALSRNQHRGSEERANQVLAECDLALRALKEFEVAQAIHAANDRLERAQDRG